VSADPKAANAGATGPGPGAAAAGGADAVAELVGEEKRILACVHCGFCLDACPTYTRLNDEADSPRGRIYLIRAVAEGRLDAGSPAFRTHIDRCLGCRACEPVCPSGVQYGHLLERARAAIGERHGIRPVDRLLLRVFGSPVLNRAAGQAGRLLRAGGAAAALARVIPARFGRLRFALRMLDATRPAALGGMTGSGRPHAPAGTGQGEDPEASDATQQTVVRQSDTECEKLGRPRVAVLEGCVQRSLFERVNRATDRVLRVNGCETVFVPGQGCCGALHAHSGDLRGARRLARANIEAFEEAQAGIVVVNAAGCGAFMKAYGELFEGDVIRERAEALASKIRDASEVLLAVGPKRGGELPLRVAWDSPCHLVHGQRLGRTPAEILAAIPGLSVEWIEGAEECCGGAGTWGMAHPELGGRILEDKVRSVRAVGADVVATPNPGCIMQIGAGLSAAGDATPVLHPIELLDESYRRLEGGK
jgi:glycolate oxidase iron-sulfur subunit